MAYEVPVGVSGSLPAHVSLAGSQYLAVYLNGTAGVDVQTSATGPCIGILQNDPTAGQACNVMFVGITKAVAGAALAAPGIALMVNGSGQLIAQTGTNTIVGYLLDTASGAGVLCTVQLA